ncbi:DUF3040 domain-containing protein [Arthrobacter sp. I2-34]|uniref:DUF3040 domain-containing protein n=1 Tax=Arthrobacter hankyongi TaxID=2904801 RepID=A0ABS9L282_9MICC|nr:DUF3040 domain-containing protein [Arthrobacter hankyongi]MCG2620771.1 DUF3040 domain-containing protein [Arthrobacter hankyongi]
MSLSDDERQRLAKLGHELEEDDPRLARTLSGKGISIFGHGLGAGALLVAAGVLLLLVGLAGNSLVLVMLGTIALVGALVRSGIDWTRRHLHHHP